MTKLRNKLFTLSSLIVIFLGVLIFIDMSEAKKPTKADIYFQSRKNLPCPKIKEAKFIYAYNYVIRYFAWHFTWVNIPEAYGCYKAGTTYPIKEAESGNIVGTAKVIKSYNLDLTTPHRDAFSYAASFRSIKSNLNFFFSREIAKSPRFYAIRLMEVKLKDIDFPWFSLKFKSELPISKSIEYKDIGKIPRFTLVDVRAPNEFKRVHLKNAINIPYRILSILRFGGGYGQFFSDGARLDGDRFKWRKKLKSKNKPIAVYGTSPFDLRPIRALIKLHNNGFKNLYFIKDGYIGASNQLITPPEEIAGVKIISFEESYKMMVNGALFLDVRAPRVDDPRKIMTAKNLPYQLGGENEDFIYKPGQKLAKTIADFKKEKDSFDILTYSNHKNKPIVIYGYDKYSWHGYRAALWAKEAGFKKVHYLRDGIASWFANYTFSNPSLINTEKPR